MTEISSVDFLKNGGILKEKERAELDTILEEIDRIALLKAKALYTPLVSKKSNCQIA